MSALDCNSSLQGVAHSVKRSPAVAERANHTTFIYRVNSCTALNHGQNKITQQLTTVNLWKLFLPTGDASEVFQHRQH